MQPSVITSLEISYTCGKAFALFGAASFGLWLAKNRFNPQQTDVKYGALILSACVIFVWIFGVTIDVFDVILSTFSIPGIELILSAALIILSSFFIPRREFITIFFFGFGVFLAIWGLLIFEDATTISQIIAGYYLRVIGTVLFSLFALPLGASSIYLEEHPENPLYIITAIWVLLEFQLVGFWFFLGLPVFIFSPIRVCGVYAILYYSMKNLKTSRPLLTGIGFILSYILTTGGVVIADLGLVLGQLAMYSGLTLAVIGTALLIFCGLSFGESLRVGFEDKSKMVGRIGILLTVVGLVAGVIGLFTLPFGIVQIDLWPFAFIYLDIAFFALVVLGSILNAFDPGRLGKFLGLAGFVCIPMVLNAQFFETVQLFFYPLLFLMIYFFVQEFRSGFTATIRVPRRKKVIPMEITADTLIKSGMHKKPEPKPIEPVKTIEPVESVDFEPEPPMEEAFIEEAETEQVPEPVEPVVQDEPTEEVELPVSDKSIRTEQKMIPVEKGEVLPDNQRMARNWFNRAFGFLEAGDLEKATEAVDKALKWQPDHPQALALKKELSEK